MGLLSAACGAADDRVDPGDLALRDLLGVQPQVVAGWDDAQRAAARQVLVAGLAAGPAVALASPLGADEAALVRAVAVGDAALDDRGQDARGLVVVSAPRTELLVLAGPRAAALLDGATAPPAVALAVEPRAWPCPAAPCDLAVLAALAVDAAPGAPAVRVQPVAQLAVIAALTDGPDGAPTLLVNPVVTAVGVPIGADRAGPGGASGVPTGAAGEPAAAVAAPPPLTRGSWTYGATRDGCATQVAADCRTCLGGGLCEPVWPSLSGMLACTTLAADEPRSYELVCVNLAVSLADVRACLQDRAPSCAIDADAIDLPAELANNAVFVDDGGCRTALDDCLAQLYGADGDGDGCGACDGCDCGGSDPNVDNGSCSDDGCQGGGCRGGDCGGGGGDCGGGGSGGSCQVAGPSRRGPGLGVALAWVLLPVPVALGARQRARSAARRVAPAPP